MGRLPRSSRAVGGKKISETHWEVSSGFVGALTAGNSGFAFATVGTRPVTLLRMRGEVVAYSDAATNPPSAVQVTYGIALVPEGSGATVRWDPVDDGNAPWLLYGTGIIAYEEKVTDVVDIPGMTSFRHVIDNKAMRILRPDVEMQLVVANTTVSGAAAVNFGYQLRWLQGA